MICLIEGCGKAVKIKKSGFCWGHYLRNKRHGHPLLGGTTIGAPQDFFEKVMTVDTDECIIWPFARDAVGYARIRHNGDNYPAYRLMCEKVHGPPLGIENHATHKCGKGNKGCINHKHLEWGTAFKNQQDRVEHGTSNRGERCAASKLTTEQAVEIWSRLNLGENSPAIAKDYGVHPRTVRDIRQGRSWAWLTGLQNPNERDRMGNLVIEKEDK